MIAHSGSGFDIYVVINNLPQWRSVVKLFENGAGIFPLKTFNVYVDENKKKILNMSLLDVGEMILLVVRKRKVLVIN